MMFLFCSLRVKAASGIGARLSSVAVHFTGVGSYAVRFKEAKPRCFSASATGSARLSMATKSNRRIMKAQKSTRETLRDLNHAIRIGTEPRMDAADAAQASFQRSCYR